MAHRKLSALFLVLALAGCAKQAVRMPSDAGRRTADAAKLERQIDSFSKATAKIRALAKVEVATGDEMRNSDAAVAISRPSMVRAELMDSLADVWAAAGSDGKKVWLSLPAKKKLYSGRAVMKNINRLIQFDLEIDEVVSLISGLPPTGGGDMVEAGRGKDRYFLSRGGDVRIWTDAKGRVVKCARYGGSGSEMDYVATFGGFGDVAGVSFPHAIEPAVFEPKGSYGDKAVDLEKMR
jgi:hypothetical protein